MIKIRTRIIALACLFCGSSTGFAQITDTINAQQRKVEKMAIMMTQPKYPVKTIGIFIYDGYQTLDAMGPYETLGNLPGVKIFFIGKKKGTVLNQRGMKVTADTSIADVKKLDILVIPGGAGATFLQTQDPELLNWIRQIDKTTIYTTSVCTGAWILGASGLLKGINATTNWYRAEEMLRKYDAIFKDERWIHDGKYWTSAGVTAGIDMSLAIINELMGEKYTQAAMLNLEYNPQPPVTGGTPKNSDPVVTEMMLEMYDAVMQPLFKKKATTPGTDGSIQKVNTPVIKQNPPVKPEAEHSNTLQQDGIDLVCHMKVYKGSTITVVYNGKQYGFCSESCKKHFLKNPVEFIK